MGACMLVRRAAFDEVGPFDERYFLFSEEVDWMRRAADRGLVGRLHARAPSASTSAAPPTAAGSSGRTSAATCATSRSTAGRARPSARAGCSARRSSSAGASTAASAARLYRDVASWLGSGDVDALIAGPD